MTQVYTRPNGYRMYDHFYFCAECSGVGVGGSRAWIRHEDAILGTDDYPRCPTCHNKLRLHPTMSKYRHRYKKPWTILIQ